MGSGDLSVPEPAREFFGIAKHRPIVAGVAARLSSGGLRPDFELNSPWQCQSCNAINDETAGDDDDSDDDQVCTICSFVAQEAPHSDAPMHPADTDGSKDYQADASGNNESSAGSGG